VVFYLIDKQGIKLGTAFVIHILITNIKCKLFIKVIIMKNKAIFTKLPKTLIAVTVLSVFLSKSLYAIDSCDVELEAGVTINESSIEFFDPDKEKQTLYKIDDNNLIVDGDYVALDDEQQALVEEYSSNIRAMVPQVRNIALEGVDLALEGVNLAFNELLGEGNNVGADLTQELSSLKDEVSTRFTVEHGFTIGENGLDNDDLLGDEFEQRIESAVENAVMGSMGSLLVALGQEMMFSGGDTDAFETRMESFGENIEHEMESRAEKIELKAERLCLQVLEIDKIEDQLQASIESLENINVITVKHSSDSQYDDKSSM